MGNKYTESQKKASCKYIKSKKRNTLTLPPDEAEALEKRIRATGYTSINQFLRDASYYYLDFIEKEIKNN